LRTIRQRYPAHLLPRRIWQGILILSRLQNL
jgi:hypothetical protein